MFVISSFSFSLKIGSFQMFVENYVDADVFLKQYEHELSPSSSSDIAIKFQEQFEKLVVLDYIIRNTGKKRKDVSDSEFG